MAEHEIRAKHFKLGEYSQIGERSQIGAIGGEAQEVVIGDSVFIGDDVRILAPRVRIGDFCTIHHHTTIYGYADVTIGPCCWIGQNAILNCTAPLTIGRGCTLSAYANIWTHFSGGDPVEGCNYDKDNRKAAVLGEDVWVGVQASIAPVNIGAKALILAGAIVTKDVPPNTVWGGNTAKDLTDKLGPPFIERSLEDKYAMMCEKLLDYHETLRDTINFRSGLGDDEFSRRQSARHYNLGGITVTMEQLAEDGTSIFDVRDRTYSKVRTPMEIGFMHFLLPLVRFYPRSR